MTGPRGVYQQPYGATTDMSDSQELPTQQVGRLVRRPKQLVRSPSREFRHDGSSQMSMRVASLVDIAAIHSGDDVDLDDEHFEDEEESESDILFIVDDDDELSWTGIHATRKLKETGELILTLFVLET